MGEYPFFGLTVTAGALGDTALQGHAGVLETLNVLVRILGPRSLLGSTLRSGAEMESDLVCLVELTLKIHISVGLG